MDRMKQQRVSRFSGDEGGSVVAAFESGGAGIEAEVGLGEFRPVA
jgi:hypothetical protein